jgi:hypothetical protein
VLNRLTLEAETWAESGTRKIGQQKVRRGPVRLPSRRLDRAHLVGGPHSGDDSTSLPTPTKAHEVPRKG